MKLLLLLVCGDLRVDVFDAGIRYLPLHRFVQLVLLLEYARQLVVLDPHVLHWVDLRDRRELSLHLGGMQVNEKVPSPSSVSEYFFQRLFDEHLVLRCI